MRGLLAHQPDKGPRPSRSGALHQEPRGRIKEPRLGGGVRQRPGTSVQPSTPHTSAAALQVASQPGPHPGHAVSPAQADTPLRLRAPGWTSPRSARAVVPPAGPRPGVPAATALRARGAPSERLGRTPHSPRRRTRPQQLPQVRCVPPKAGKGHRVRRRRARGTPGKRKERRPGPVRPGPLRTTAPQAATSRPAGSLERAR